MTITQLPTPGLHLDIPFADYLAWPCLSQSVLKAGLDSMAHLHAADMGERVKEPTDDMKLGSAMHTAFLEPEQMCRRVVEWTGGARRGPEWKDFEARNGDKIILTAAYYESLVGMVESLKRHPFVREWMGRVEAVEASYLGTIEGVTVKARCDAITPDPLVDLKKVRSTDPAKIMRTVLDFGYHIQAAIYTRLFKRERFVLVCVEDGPSYDVVPFELSPGLIREGNTTALALLQSYNHCCNTGVWPGRSDEIVLLETPEWMSSGDGITIGTERVFGE